MRFGAIDVAVLDDGTRITFEDGLVVEGAPEDTDAYRATAQRLGYGDDTLRMCKEHEATHIALNHLLGLESPTMLAVRRGVDDLHDLNCLEEAAVLAIQQYAVASGIDLLTKLTQLSEQL
jgi:hypothetical protein